MKKLQCTNVNFMIKEDEKRRCVLTVGKSSLMNDDTDENNEKKHLKTLRLLSATARITIAKIVIRG
jgi:hypothetical protein